MVIIIILTFAPIAHTWRRKEEKMNACNYIRWQMSEFNFNTRKIIIITQKFIQINEKWRFRNEFFGLLLLPLSLLHF